jgi:DNA-binding response OmpR family regulator
VTTDSPVDLQRPSLFWPRSGHQSFAEAFCGGNEARLGPSIRKCNWKKERKVSRRIVIVDDYEDIVFCLKEGLIGAVNGYEVETACSGKEALAAMAALPFDLVITDLQMPGKDGLVLIQQVRERYSRTSLILMTCHRDREIEAVAVRLGACGKLTKPFHRNELLAKVQMALAQSGAPA